MLLCRIDIPAGQAVTAMHPENISEILSAAYSANCVAALANNGGVFAVQSGCQAPLHTVDKAGMLLFSKDKSTMLRALASIPERQIQSRHGTIAIIHGNYRDWDKTASKNRANYLVSALITRGLNVKSRYKAWKNDTRLDTVETAQVAHLYNRKLLVNRGYFAFVIGRAAFTEKPDDVFTTYVGDYTVSFGHLATLLNHCKEVTYTEPKRGPNEGWRPQWWERNRNQVLGEIINENDTRMQGF